jgi:putative transposase
MSDSIARSYKYRCYPNAEQEKSLIAWRVACHDVQRLCIKDRRTVAYLRRNGRPNTQHPTWASQCRDVTQVRKVDSFWNDVPADTMSAIVKRVDQAWQKMWSERKAGNWKAKVRWADTSSAVGLAFRGSARGTQMIGFNGRYGYWQLAGAFKLGILKVRMHRPIPEGAVINQAHITRRADGWYISFSCDIPRPEPLPPANKAINGVDLNVIHDGDNQQVAVVDDGRVYKVTSHLKRNARKLAHMQRMVDPKRKVKGSAKAADLTSKRSQKRRAKIERLHQRVARQREHTQQYIAKRLAETANTTRFEDLNLKGMRKRGKGRHKSGLNRAMSTAAPGQLIRLTQEKAEVAGRKVEKVPAAYTSQVCSACGDKGTKKGLNIRQWVCAACGVRHDRDINAARNIAAGGVKNKVAAVQVETINAQGGRLNLGSKRRSVNCEESNSLAEKQPGTALPDFRKLAALSHKKRVANKNSASQPNTMQQLELFE